MSISRAVEQKVSRRRIDWISGISRYGTIISLVLLVVGFSAAQWDVFPTIGNILSILNQIAILGVISFGLTVCLVMGLFDLSIAAMATLGGYLAPYILVTLHAKLGIATTDGFVLLVASVIGVVNGTLVSYLGISAFIETLAMGSIITGVLLGISNSLTILSGIPDGFLVLGQGSLFNIPNPVFVMALVGVALWLLLEHTQLGRNLYAIGGNAEASRLSGISVKSYALVALGLSAACAALGGLMAASNLGAGRPQGVGDTYLLNAFVAVFIGASTLRPGKFHILGTFIGVLLIGVINNGLSIIGVQTYWQYIVQGALLILALFSAGLPVLRRR